MSRFIFTSDDELAEFVHEAVKEIGHCVCPLCQSEIGTEDFMSSKAIRMRIRKAVIKARDLTPERNGNGLIAGSKVSAR